MDENGHICLTDFGMAKILKKGEQAQSFCGTPEYLSPEIITGVGHSKAADWWALGIFTFEMMFALPPFYNNNQYRIRQIIHFLRGSPAHPHLYYILAKTPGPAAWRGEEPSPSQQIHNRISTIA